MTKLFDYRLFGLHVRSALQLPELPAAAPAGEPDVLLQLAKDLADPGGAGAHRETVVSIAGVARYTVSGGTRILVEPEPGAADANVRLYLLGSAMGVLLHQRGLLPLHANAVEIGGRAFAFMGPSGAGKSTLAAWFHDQGHRIIADDVCVVRFQGQRPYVSPGLPRLRLWREVIESSGREAADYSRSYAGDETYEKYDVPVGAGATVAGDVPLAAVYLLSTEGRQGIAEMGGLAAAQALFANTYRGGYVASAGNAEGHWQACIDLVRSTPIFRFVRSWDASRFAIEAKQAVDHAAQVP